MIKRTINLLVTLALYELGKYVIEQVFILLTSVDDIDMTFPEYDHAHLNGIKAEVSE
ncbi:transcriptional regulator [Staphylococcus pseudintermedius]|uniref:transcriptional activator RinB n=1 Tax=Staphylococcus pseudintermedius TaxID=283734 RepID=UPI0019330887|nr:transcriptional regulator [Staphylococcus pseudintermedius]EGQ3293790.1 transcriptional regulator [Staphylococcus pseudintermedius]EGQ3835297.1 transcriptional regulator [Staphylococcus pseudintermedius]EGQ4134025.1 transcriptional regulator [Staphylococcus pseudintermedius]EGQ4284591.1 transcriptional regulator [Staphylococcus pseudintermedius]EHK9622987.1 transcriptional regulator [Staphylococcus pseudintermedius]